MENNETIKIKMPGQKYDQEFSQGNEGYSINFYRDKIADQEGIATETHLVDLTEPNDKWYDIKLNNGTELKGIHESWFKTLKK